LRIKQVPSSGCDIALIPHSAIKPNIFMVNVKFGKRKNKNSAPHATAAEYNNIRNLAGM